MSSSKLKRLRRRGSLTVEMLMVVVVLAIITVGVAGFGVFFENAQQVALAARVGAEKASQNALPTTPGSSPGVPTAVSEAIQNQLGSSGMHWCHIRLEHNVNPPANGAVVLESDFGPPCDCPTKTPLDNPPAPDTRYVRLTVCVPLNQVFPKELSIFGESLFSVSKTYEHTAIYRYELGTP